MFLSFRGEDTGATFTSYLHHSLTDAGVIVYEDDGKRGIGEEFSTSVSQAIKESRISFIVFSSNYASSIRCLQELLEIMERRRTNGQVVVPIFYEVDPAYVRHQKGPFGKALQHHMERFGKDKVEAWRAALKDAANIAGFELTNKSRYFNYCLFYFQRTACLLSDHSWFSANSWVTLSATFVEILELS